MTFVSFHTYFIDWIKIIIIITIIIICQPCFSVHNACLNLPYPYISTHNTQSTHNSSKTYRSKKSSGVQYLLGWHLYETDEPASTHTLHLGCDCCFLEHGQHALQPPMLVMVSVSREDALLHEIPSWSYHDQLSLRKLSDHHGCKNLQSVFQFLLFLHQLQQYSWGILARLACGHGR